MSKRNYLLFVVLTVLFSIVSVSECPTQPQPEKPISAIELKQVIKSEDEGGIWRAMNRVKQNQESHDLMTFVMKLWVNDKKAYPDLPWHVVNSEVVRIEIANVLAQANNNGFVKVDREELRKYARQVIAGSDQSAKSTAISTLGLIRNSADVELIKQIALEENPRTFLSAIIALTESCDARAGVALDDIRRRVGSNESKRILRDASGALAGYKYGCEKP